MEAEQQIVSSTPLLPAVKGSVNNKQSLDAGSQLAVCQASPLKKEELNGMPMLEKLIWPTDSNEHSKLAANVVVVVVVVDVVDVEFTLAGLT